MTVIFIVTIETNRIRYIGDTGGSSAHIAIASSLAEAERIRIEFIEKYYCDDPIIIERCDLNKINPVAIDELRKYHLHSKKDDYID